MKVLHILNTDRFSGAENVVCQIIGMFRGDAHTEMAYCSPDGPIADVLCAKDIPFFPIEKLSAQELKRVIRTYRPDVLHAHDFRASVVSVHAAAKLPIVSHLHNNPPWIRRKGIYSRLYKIASRRLSAILTVSDSIGREYVYGEKLRNKIYCVGNPVCVDSIVEKSEEPSIDEGFDICFCGRLTQQKNPRLFLKIAAMVKEQIPSVRIAMLGDGELRDETEAVIAELGLGSNIKMFGFVNNPYAVMRSCKLLCVTSAWEGFGLVAVEALALGLPVVCSGVGGLAGIVTDACGKICVSPAEYVQEILALLSDENYRARKSSAALAESRKMENTAQYKAVLSDVYERQCPRASRGSG